MERTDVLARRLSELGSVPNQVRLAASASPATAPTSPSFLYSAVNSASLHPDSSETTPPQQSPSDLQRGLLPRRKRLARKKHRRDRRLLHRARSQILRHDPNLQQFLRSPCDRLAGLSKFPHKCGAGAPVREGRPPPSRPLRAASSGSLDNTILNKHNHLVHRRVLKLRPCPVIPLTPATSHLEVSSNE